MTIQFSLLDHALIRYRTSHGQERHATLPELFVAFNHDEVCAFPALRPHQRHPWHAFLVQLAAIALYNANRKTPFATAADWRAALLALTPDDGDGAAFALVTPDDRPAFMQPPCGRGTSLTWKKRIATPDALDMLVTSRNHDLKGHRMLHAEAEDWIYALVSLQTQEGFLGAGNYGISRMNGGFASRPAVGVVPVGRWGKRWTRDVQVLLRNREAIVKEHALKENGGVALVWLQRWEGDSSLSFSELDPFYIEVCRRVRLQVQHDALNAIATGSKVVRIAANERCGVTGDAWTPINVVEGKALSITPRGFDYKLATKLAFSTKYKPTIARELLEDDGKEGLFILAQGIARGKGKTEGYHERRIPIREKTRGLLLRQESNVIEEAAEERIRAIDDVRKTLWGALCALLGNGDQNVSDDTKNKANHFARAFEQGEDRRFFDDLSNEIEAADGEAEHDQWLLALVDRAAAVLEQAFVAGPRSAERVYRARGAALSRFHLGLRFGKAPPRIARVLKQRDEARRATQPESFEEVLDESN
ncbi:type I-E CRISPR-associated protein Cse1/CasA [Caballeronia sp. ATUFL_F1_KS4A]|uniref:type I-E CRISPR-associated protein Cse1/CasA n=1 Tax=Caballeronia sp. ATUFL_F1_KS4A TaxID=2921768 RepID=UPI0020278DE0|nr:type I-E CRISPR-associated protein Cse1/CasA [Caballeronia sp. ATUFL_F1_KS4A]